MAATENVMIFIFDAPMIGQELRRLSARTPADRQ